MKMPENLKTFIAGAALSVTLLASGIRCEDELPPKDEVTKATNETGEEIMRTLNFGEEDCYEGCPPQDDSEILCPNNPIEECDNDANIDPKPFLQEPLNYE